MQSKLNIHTSSHTDVVSLPVKRYWPMKIVSPALTACTRSRIYFRYMFIKCRKGWCMSGVLDLDLGKTIKVKRKDFG